MFPPSKTKGQKAVQDGPTRADNAKCSSVNKEVLSHLKEDALKAKCSSADEAVRFFMRADA